MLVRDVGNQKHGQQHEALGFTGKKRSTCWVVERLICKMQTFNSVPNIIPSNQILYKVNIEPYRPITNLRIYMFEPSPDLRVTNRRRFRWLNGKVFDGISGKCQRYHGVLGHIPLCRQHQSIESNMHGTNQHPSILTHPTLANLFV
jgi:hypothetical protein